jgi:hypothetical protein
LAAPDVSGSVAGQALRAILAADPLRSRIPNLVGSLALPDCWIGAGFVRNAVWDRLHGRQTARLRGDVDVIWFDPQLATPADDARLEARLQALDPSITWSVKNQARMHRRNDDAPYCSATDAMRCWPETATAVAVRQTASGSWEIAAPFGLADLFGLVLRPTPRFVGAKRAVFLGRVRSKGWLDTWPLLRIEMDPITACQHDPEGIGPDPSIAYVKSPARV